MEKKCFNDSKILELIRAINDGSCAFRIVISIMFRSAKLACFFILKEKGTEFINSVISS